ncbi:MULTISPECIES: hypothetical protein [Peribacillus]|uniref:hypothetical protein n=1 Tax=Peribacillus TaxID=2675229 RepID=UPI0020400934|nr:MULTISPECIES: hypothetical protein [Peribacillus]MCM3672697.1 hypothetical protein [Peribacillus simplex]MDQ0881295.1 hypothetical protein [Peribacillus sp. V2I11]
MFVEAETESGMGGGENGAAMDRGGNSAPPGINGNMGQKGAGNSSSSKDMIILSSVLLILLLGAMAFSHFFKRRGKKGY